MARPVTNRVIVLPSPVLSNAGPHELAINFAKSNGWFSGTLTLTNPPASLKFKGAVLQRQGHGAGCFRKAGQSGWVYLGPASSP